MTRTQSAIAASLSVLFAAMSAEAKVIWKGDFETGDTSQWSESEMISSNRLQIVSDPVAPGSKHALRALVKKGDDPINASGNRNELLYTGDMPKSGERVYRWQTLWPSDFKSANTWQLFTQFHHTGCCGSPPVEFFTQGNTMYLRVDGKDLWKGPLETGRWRDFVFHVYWSTSKSDGFVELFVDGKQVLPKTATATLYPGDAVYLKQGLYRNESISYDQVLFHDGMTVATSLDDVMPKAAPQPMEEEPGTAPIDPLPGTDGSDGSDLADGRTDGEPLSPQVLASGGCSMAGSASLLPLGAVALVLARRRKKL